MPLQIFENSLGKQSTKKTLPIMSAFVRTDIPDSVNTLEKLVVWAEFCLQHLNPELTVVEASGGLDRAALSQPWFITASTPPTWRVISRSSIAITNNWQRGGKIWNFASELSATAIPSEFKTN